MLALALNEEGVIARVLRGTRMRTLDGLFDEFAAALQFPHYFGENYQALEECLTDFSWLTGPGYVLLISDAALFLAEDNMHELPTTMRLLRRVGDTYAQPVADGEWWDRPALPFHVVTQETASNQRLLRQRMEVAAAKLHLLDG